MSIQCATGSLKPGVHTNDFAPIHRLRALKLGHASLATVFRPGRLTLQPILRENLESPVLRYQPITNAVVTDACLNTRWHHGAYTSAVLRESLGLDRVVTVYVELSRPDWLATVQSGRKQVQSRICTPSLTCSALILNTEKKDCFAPRSNETLSAASAFLVQYTNSQIYRTSIINHVWDTCVQASRS